MASFSSLNTITLALLALILVIATVQSAPTPVADPKVPVFSIFSKNNEKGAKATVSKYGCHNHGLKAVAGVHYRSGPHAQIKFYSGKDCKGKVTHSMPINTYKSMGGPYNSQSVLVFKGTGSSMQ
ncbi:hypothetical protein EC957_003423 [Mortierella hygrophila]|uniref:Uncharacterized protein n=1 Tax=Mortierella hygrophila TaxID=979708 RepID=A0A9P6K108_9FUNG|nr:hypothetical protein EC957_003423 [Mortierella hygrophila]